jgi:type IV secretory pathway TraG/TraD family ATPase VirD4
VITFFAKTNSRNKEVKFGIRRADRGRHMYVIGKTGMGKSTLLENLAIQDIQNGEGLAFIDPHGSTAERLLSYVPKERIRDVIYFAPFDLEYPVAFNVMEDVGYDKRHLVVSGLLSAFRKIWVDAWSARMEYILSNTLLALLEYPNATLLDVNRMLIDKAFRKAVVEHCADPIVKRFWTDEFANYSDRYTQDATPAIQNKVGQFATNPLIRNIIGQPVSSFNLRDVMDTRKILIINLSKGRIGETNAALLGSMLVTKIYLAAMSRADDNVAKLPDFYFYVDEFQNFANESFSDILSEARKYKLNLIIAHQYIEQMEDEVRNAVFGNVGTTVAFRVGPFDAETLERIFNPQFNATDLVNLGFAQIYLTLMIDGVGSQPFSATTLPPFDMPGRTYVREIQTASRARFANERIRVEAEIARH